MDTVEKLWAIEQIRQVKARFFRLLDTQQWEAWGDVFTEDVDLVMPPIAEADGGSPPKGPLGREALVKWRISMPIHEARHFGHMPEIELTSATTATGIWSMMAHDKLDDGGVRQSFGWYEEEYRLCDDGRWRISKMGVTGLMLA